jgi:uncharacterized protein involved in response to NO
MVEPFRLFFPFGWVMGVLFLGIWPAYAFLGIVDYPGVLHVQGVVSLAIGSFAVGFLLTALPRFTGTDDTKPFFVWTLFSLSILEAGLLVSPFGAFAKIAMALKFLMVVSFAGSRVLKGVFPVPPSFIWLGFGLIAAAVGGVGVFFDAGAVFKPLLFRGFLTGIYIGVGGRLIPILTGKASECFLMPVPSLSRSFFEDF